MIVDLINITAFIFTSFWAWFLVWAIFFISGALLFYPLIRLLKKPSFTLSAYLSFLTFALLIWQLSYLKIFPLHLALFALLIWLAFSIIGFLIIKPFDLDFPLIKLLVKEFILFTLLTAFWFFIRGFQPNIIGLEKYMDLGFVNSITKTTFLPAKDMWWINGHINYYYFGHYLGALLALLSRIPTYYSYNLALSSIFATAFILMFYLTYNLLAFVFPRLNPKKILTLSLLSTLFLNFASNWQTPYGVITAYFFKQPRSFYWYPDATRFIDYRPGSTDKTIHEFPAYSHVVADLHGHLSVLPIELVLVFLALIFYFVLKPKPITHRHLFVSFLAGAIISILFMTNSWDLMGFALIWGFIVLAKYTFNPNLNNLKSFFILALVSLFTFIVFILPFKLSFTPFFQGIDFVHARSPFWMWYLLWGPFLTPILFNLPFFKSHLKTYQKPLIFVLILTLIAFYLLLFPEILYMKDIYIKSFHRANTMFKLTYQAYTILTLLTPVFIVFLSTKRYLFTYLALFGFTLPLMYPFYSIPGYYGSLQPNRWQKGYGWAYLRSQTNGDYQLLQFITRNIPDQPNIIEAVGDGYTQFGRVSANTGLPTYLGWPVHEWLWRNQGYGPVGARRQQVADFYQTNTTLAQKQNFIRQNQIKYIVIGWAERQAYPNLDMKNLLKLGQIIYHDPKTNTYLIKTNLN